MLEEPHRLVPRAVTLIESERLSSRLGSQVLLASETFQHTGSFKYRAAANVVRSVPHPGVITASSGNFGQALAFACQSAGKRCIVVMPDTSAEVKVAAVREYGAKVELIEVNRISRQSRVEQLAAEYPEMYVASAYDDPLVIEGNASLGDELAATCHRMDVVLAPVGGGGLTAGLVTGLRRSGCRTRVYGVEPQMANDAARSFQRGEIVRNETEPQTVADGVRTVSLGRHNWAVLRDTLSGVVEVTEQQIIEATRLLFNLANLKVEPTGALPIAALLAQGDQFRNQRVCCVISGGNVDPSVLASIIVGDRG